MSALFRVIKRLDASPIYQACASTFGIYVAGNAMPILARVYPNADTIGIVTIGGPICATAGLSGYFLFPVCAPLLACYAYRRRMLN